MVDVFGLLVGNSFGALPCLKLISPGAGGLRWIGKVGDYRNALRFTLPEIMLLQLLVKILRLIGLKHFCMAGGPPFSPQNENGCMFINRLAKR